jgi:transposase
VIPTYYHARTFFEGSERMRGPDEQNGGMFSYVVPEARVRPDHPLRPIRRMTDEVFAALSPRFTKMYSDIGRPSIPPEQLLRALLLQYLYSIRSERLLMEEIDYSVLFRWFIGLGMDDAIWSPTTFSKNRDRLLRSDIAAAFFDAVLDQARTADLLSDEHFTVDGTLLESWASLKSFRPKDDHPTTPPDDPGNPTVNFHGESRRNDTHRSTTDPDARLARKGPGREAKLSYAGHVLLDNRHGLVSNVCVTAATGTSEREAALLLLAEAPGAATVAGDKHFDVPSFVAAVRARGITPHVARKVNYSAIDGRTTRHEGYALSQRRRKLVEQVFGWMKTVGGLRKLRHRGGDLADWNVTFAAAAYNLIRMRTLFARPA